VTILVREREGKTTLEWHAGGRIP